jgi:serine/threonine protein phosphatase 1
MRRLVDHVGLRRLETERPSVPKDMAVFAVGDLHGRLDLLVKMHQEILQRSKDLPEHFRKVIIYLGDYIDHGPDSADVIDTLISAALPGFRSVYLLGNHELSFLSFLKGDADFLRWTKSQTVELPDQYMISQNLNEWLHDHGGLQTLRSYGLQVGAKPDAQTIAQLRIDLLRRIPTDHLEFLEKLDLKYCIGDFFFTHAGVDPSRSLSEQLPSDLLSIGNRFLQSNQILDKIIVHGHTPFQSACIKQNRIGLDTEAYRSGKLSGLMITSSNAKTFAIDG